MDVPNVVLLSLHVSQVVIWAFFAIQSLLYWRRIAELARKNPTKGDPLSVSLGLHQHFAKKGVYTFTASAIITFVFFLLEVFA